jgi:hypothetical protein
MVHPKRICECVVPQCNVPGAQQALSTSESAVPAATAAAAAVQQGMKPRGFRRRRLAGVGCDFCDRDVNTYAR